MRGNWQGLAQEAGSSDEQRKAEKQRGETAAGSGGQSSSTNGIEA
jgi:hypothetical protein